MNNKELEQIGESIWNTYKGMAHLLIGESNAQRRRGIEALRKKGDPESLRRAAELKKRTTPVRLPGDPRWGLTEPFKRAGGGKTRVPAGGNVPKVSPAHSGAGTALARAEFRKTVK